jgi:hypothetical protein
LSQDRDYVARELRFWLQVMGDHARFIKNSLNPDETNFIMVAGNFIDVFDRLLEKSRQTSTIKGQLVNESYQTTLSLRDCKRELLAARLKNTAVTSLSPTFYNHMLNELEDFLRVLAESESEGAGSEGILGRHLLWSLDAAGHAAIIGSDLDKTEYPLIARAQQFEQSFDRLYIKAVELTGFFRSLTPSAEPALAAYNVIMTEEMKGFMIFLESLRQGITQAKVLGRLIALVADHMFREECYYLSKIAESQPGISAPDCDPGRPRVEG